MKIRLRGYCGSDNGQGWLVDTRCIFPSGGVIQWIDVVNGELVVSLMKNVRSYVGGGDLYLEEVER